MDILTHALVGAATGLPFGSPGFGACCAVLPDIVLGMKRKLSPTVAYNLTHSLLFLLLVPCVSYLLPGTRCLTLLAFLSVLSHVVLDIPTHGKEWAPPLLYPFSKKRFSLGNEWEFFNFSWQFGACLSIAWIWISLCLWIIKST